MAKLIAKERFFYGGRNVEKDEEFEALDQDVALLTDAISPRARRPAIKVVEETPPRQRQAVVRTRAMKPEAEAAQSGAAATDDLLGTAGRYHRADMRAED